MCGRFALGNVQGIKDRFSTINNVVNIKPSWNIVPGSYVPTITKNGPISMTLMKWGLIPAWAKDPKIGFKMVNARAEDILHKPSFRKPVRSQRCIVPSDGFYEWKTINIEGKDEKYPWFIGLKNRELFGFAGIYDVWKDAEGYKTASFAIITTSPNKIINPIHNRMPVILEEESEKLWLDQNSNILDVIKLLQPYPENKMVAYPVSKRVSNPNDDSVDLISPLP